MVPSEFQGDVRSLPRIRATTSAVKPEFEPFPPFVSKLMTGLTAPATVTRAATRSMPSPAVSFDGLDSRVLGRRLPAGHGGRRRAELLRAGRQHLDRHLQQVGRRTGRGVHVQHALEHRQLGHRVRHPQPAAIRR